MKIILIGYGTVGKEVQKVLEEKNLNIDYIVRSSGIFDSRDSQVDNLENFSKYIDSNSVVFISTPTQGKGENSLVYYTQALTKGARVITCEKAVLAYNWDLVQTYKGKIQYSATVGGNSGILPAIAEYKEEIVEIKAVVNGTLNYIADKQKEGLSPTELFTDVMSKGFAEPGSANFDEVIQNELKDVRYKAAIFANHSGMYAQIFTPEDIQIEGWNENFRCIVLLNKEGVTAGFMKTEDTSWFPQGVNNCLYINNIKMAEGPGAGGRATAERMYNDFKTFC